LVIPKVKFSSPTYYEVLAKNNDLVGTVSAKTGRLELGIEALSNIEGFKLVGQGRSTKGFITKPFVPDFVKAAKTGNFEITGKQALQAKGIAGQVKGIELKASDVTQVYESFGTGKQYPAGLTDAQLNAAESLISKDKLENISGAKFIIQPKALPRASKQTGSIVGIESGNVSKYLKALSREAKLSKANNEIIGDLTKINKSTKKRGFKFQGSKVTFKATSNKPLGTVTQFANAESVKGALEKLVKVEKPSKGKSRGGLFSGTRLGGKAIDLTGEYEILSYPQGKGPKGIDILKSLSNEKVDLNLGTKTANKTGQKSAFESLLKNNGPSRVKTVNINDLLKNLSIEPRREPKDKDRFGIGSVSGLKLSSLTNQQFDLDVAVKQATIQIPKFRQRQTTKVKFDIPELPRIKLPKAAGAYTRARKGRKGVRVKLTNREFEVKDLISASLGENSALAKAFNKKFGKLY